MMIKHMRNWHQWSICNEKKREWGKHQTFINILTTRTTTSCKINSNMICK